MWLRLFKQGVGRSDGGDVRGRGVGKELWILVRLEWETVGRI